MCVSACVLAFFVVVFLKKQEHFLPLTLSVYPMNDFDDVTSGNNATIVESDDVTSGDVTS